MAAELAAVGAKVIMAGNPQAAMILKSATASVPIVFVALADPA